MFLSTITSRFNEFTEALSEETGLSEAVIIILIIVAIIVVAKIIRNTFARIVFLLSSSATTLISMYFTYMN